MGRISGANLSIEQLRKLEKRAVGNLKLLPAENPSASAGRSCNVSSRYVDRRNILEGYETFVKAVASVCEDIDAINQPSALFPVPAA